jgi:hypothetical protein
MGPSYHYVNIYVEYFYGLCPAASARQRLRAVRLL